MTTKTTTAKTPAWLRFSREVDAQCEANTTPAQVQAAYEAYVNNGPKVVQVNGQQSYRDAGTQDRYTVGYGGERTYNRPATTAVEPATDKQKNFLDDLLVKRVHVALTDDVIAKIKTDKAQTSRFITFLLAQPKVADQAPAPKVEVLVEVPADAPRARLDFSAIPDGYYALVVDGVTKFYRVSTSKRNGFKNVQVQASDNLHMLFGKAGIAVLHRLVEAGLKDAQALYASELGRCYVCGRTLTDEESRAAGIGPICRDK